MFLEFKFTYRNLGSHLLVSDRVSSVPRSWRSEGRCAAVLLGRTLISQNIRFPLSFLVLRVIAFFIVHLKKIDVQEDVLPLQNEHILILKCFGSLHYHCFFTLELQFFYPA